MQVYFLYETVYRFYHFIFNRKLFFGIVVFLFFFCQNALSIWWYIYMLRKRPTFEHQVSTLQKQEIYARWNDFKISQDFKNTKPHKLNFSFHIKFWQRSKKLGENNCSKWKKPINLRNMANYEVFYEVISSSINFIFLKSVCMYIPSKGIFDWGQW